MKKQIRILAVTADDQFVSIGDVYLDVPNSPSIVSVIRTSLIDAATAAFDVVYSNLAAGTELQFGVVTPASSNTLTQQTSQTLSGSGTASFTAPVTIDIEYAGAARFGASGALVKSAAFTPAAGGPAPATPAAFYFASITNNLPQFNMAFTDLAVGDDPEIHLSQVQTGPYTIYANDISALELEDAAGGFTFPALAQGTWYAKLRNVRNGVPGAFFLSTVTFVNDSLLPVDAVITTPLNDLTPTFDVSGTDGNTNQTAHIRATNGTTVVTATAAVTANGAFTTPVTFSTSLTIGTWTIEVGRSTGGGQPITWYSSDPVTLVTGLPVSVSNQVFLFTDFTQPTKSWANPGIVNNTGAAKTFVFFLVSGGGYTSETLVVTTAAGTIPVNLRAQDTIAGVGVRARVYDFVLPANTTVTNIAWDMAGNADPSIYTASIQVFMVENAAVIQQSDLKPLIRGVTTLSSVDLADGGWTVPADGVALANIYSLNFTPTYGWPAGWTELGEQAGANGSRAAGHRLSGGVVAGSISIAPASDNIIAARLQIRPA